MGLARMNGQVGFAELLAALEGRGLPGKGASDIFRVHEEEQFFVPPEFLVKEDLGDLTGPVLLLSARGAAGKSRTAEELSRILGAPLWKLERDKAVGSTSLPFTIGGYLGVADPYAALERFDRPTVLIDSLDEARARVSGTSWAEFLESLSEATRLGCHLVLLGRERTLEEAWLQLSDVGTMPAWLEISHFGPAERVTYVDGVVLQWSRKGSATTGPYYRAARDAVLNSLAGSVPGPASETFAGYAPVLDAVAAVLLQEGNHYAVSKDFAAASGSMRHLAELRRILDDLLVRDQQKMLTLAAELALDPEYVYAPDEQIDWLWYALEGGREPELKYIGDGDVRDEYVKRVQTFLDDHPFRNEDRWASAVFPAYVASRRLGTTVTGSRLVEIGNESGLLFDLTAVGSEELVLDEWQFAALHASITATADRSRRVSVCRATGVSSARPLPVSRPGRRTPTSTSVLST